MEFKFVVINADNVGEGIGDAIVNDNHENLSKITGNLKQAHGDIESWVNEKGGEIITNSGDEVMFKLPIESIQDGDLESLKEQYSTTSEHTVTIGVGSKMSEAAKALIYGKMNEKDQIVEYSEDIEQKIQGNKENPQEEIGEDSEGTQKDDGDLDIEEENNEEDSTKKDSESLIDDAVEEDGEKEEIEVPKDQVDGDYGSEEMEEAQPEEELDMDEEEEFVEDAMDNRSDEIDPDSIEEDMEDEVVEDQKDLKQKIAQALISFKNNKASLQQMQQENPEMYEAQMSMLQSMIDMAKILNMNPEADMKDSEMQDSFPENNMQDQIHNIDEVEKNEKIEMPKELAKSKDKVKISAKEEKEVGDKVKIESKGNPNKKTTYKIKPKAKEAVKVSEEKEDSSKRSITNKKKLIEKK